MQLALQMHLQLAGQKQHPQLLLGLMHPQELHPAPSAISEPASAAVATPTAPSPATSAPPAAVPSLGLTDTGEGDPRASFSNAKAYMGRLVADWIASKEGRQSGGPADPAQHPRAGYQSPEDSKVAEYVAANATATPPESDAVLQAFISPRFKVHCMHSSQDGRLVAVGE